MTMIEVRVSKTNRNHNPRIPARSPAKSSVWLALETRRRQLLRSRRKVRRFKVTDERARCRKILIIAELTDQIVDVQNELNKVSTKLFKCPVDDFTQEEIEDARETLMGDALRRKEERDLQKLADSLMLCMVGVTVGGKKGGKHL